MPPGEGNNNPLQLFLLRKSHRQRNLVGYSAEGCKRVGLDLAAKQQQQIYPQVYNMNRVSLANNKNKYPNTQPLIY